MAKLNVVVVGCGAITHGHLEAWKKVKQANIVAVSDLDEKLAEETARIWKIPHYYSSFDEMLEKTKPDVVNIATPPQSHAQLAIQAMKSGSNIIIEKPMTLKTEDAEEIVKCQEETKLKAGVIHNWLFEPVIVHAISKVNQGQLGQILSAHVDVINTKIDSMTKTKDHWSHKYVGGRFGEMLAHPIYLLREFIGQCDVESVQTQKLGNYPWMISDEFFGIFRSEHLYGTAHASFNGSREAIFVTVYGTDAILRSEIKNAITNIFPAKQDRRLSKVLDSINQSNQIITSSFKSAGQVVFGRWETGHQRYIRLFADSVINQTEVPISVEDGCAVVKVVEKTCKEIGKIEEERMNK